MKKVLPFKTRDQMDKEELSKNVLDLIESGIDFVLLGHRVREDGSKYVELNTSLHLTKDRIVINGIIEETKQIMTHRFLIVEEGHEPDDTEDENE